MKKSDFLLELRIEDLPAKELKNISESFFMIFKNILKKNKIKYDKISLFSTPRRLAVTINTIKYIQENKKIRKKGPLWKYCFNDKNQVTPIAMAWIKHCGINIEDAESTIINKKRYLTYQTTYKTISLLEILKKIILYVLMRIPSKKTMHWNEKKFQFSRPIRNILALLNSQIIPIKFFHLYSNRFSRGHLFMHPEKIEINFAKQYRSKFFSQFYVMINYKKRKNFIKKEIENLSKKLNGITKICDQQLDEITSSVEWPVILHGSFNVKYLKIPKKILIHTMEICQQYFPVYDSLTKKITTKFIFISNTETKNPNKIIEGNENVLQSKLSNIIFFLKKDLKTKIFDRLLLLKNICFKENLGTMYDKTNRMCLLSIFIIKNFEKKVQKEDMKRAALLSKCDLTTYMIIEHPELQGSIGMYYAIKNKEKKEVALAIKEQYLPNASNAKLPTQPISYALSIAEKMDTITGIFSLEKNSKNHNDPFALRRAAIGIIHIIIEKKIKINLIKLIKKSINLYPKIINPKKLKNIILKFLLSKYKYFFIKKGYEKKIIKSIFSLNIHDCIEINTRISILEKFYRNNKMNKIIQTFKRIENILKKQPDYSTIYCLFPTFEKNKNISEIENNLIKTLDKIQNNIKKKKSYLTIFTQIEKLIVKINKFFEKSYIYDKNKEKHLLRISILKYIKNIFLYTANFYYL
ncbi:glycine--tRNA ligase subunit beta [Buchnera aphidicola]|uniref:glycine--tRNA ligase subunit beta n=1 Tax=Buchnera aphidicola TaxID=9 RepID=UPI00094D1C17|nr:glycine--tRNA ligase subunit beta [Buchnera aphidicola]